MKAKRSGQTERRGEGGLGVSLDYSDPIRTHAEEGQAERSGQAERNGAMGEGSSPTTEIKFARTPKKARPSVAEMVSPGVFPDYGDLTHTHTKEGPAERSGQAERSGEGWVTTAIQLARTPKKAK
jgi:hypothetical protein